MRDEDVTLVMLVVLPLLAGPCFGLFLWAAITGADVWWLLLGPLAVFVGLWIFYLTEPL